MSGRSAVRALSLLLLFALFWATPAAAQISTVATQDLTCAGQRQGGVLGCNAKEFTVNTIVQNAMNSLPTCTIGGTADIDVVVHLEGTNTDRQDVGLFVGQNGNDPGQTTGVCSVATFPTAPLPFKNNDGDACGDYAANAISDPTIFGVKVECKFGTNPADPNTYGKLLFPYVLTYFQNTGDVCNGPQNVTPGTTSKCNKGVGSVAGITLTGFVSVTKQTLPDGDPTVFNFATTGTAVLSNPLGDTNFTLTDGNTNTIETVVDMNTKTVTVTEASTVGWNPAASITCVDLAGQPVPTYVTTNGATRSFTASLDLLHPAVACTITNTFDPPLTISKQWVNAIVNDAVTVSTTGAANNATLASTANTANETDTATSPVGVNAGESITFGETFSNGSASNYMASLTCTGNNTPLVGNMLTVNAADTAISCTEINTRRSATLTLHKSWSNAVVDDAVSISTTGGANSSTLNSTANAATEIDTGDPITVFAGEAITISEVFLNGLPGNYASSLSCTGNGAALAGNVLTVSGADTAIICTELNARTPISLTVAKTWQNAIVNDSVTVTTAGGINTATVLSTALAPNQTNTGTPVNVFAGETITVGELFGVGSPGNYITTLSCTGNATPTQGNTLTVTVGDSAILCTLTNARRSATLALAKTWQNAHINDAVSVTASGGINGGTLNSTANSANETDNGTPITVFVGEAITIGESFTAGSATNYNSSLSCTGNGTVLAGNVLTINAEDTAITCTETNARRSATLTLAKTWANANVNDAVTVSSIGSVNSSPLASTANTANETDTGAAFIVFAGEAISISEAFTTGSASNYTSTLNCSGNATTLAGNVLTVNAADSAIVCTQTNARQASTLTLAKTWQNAMVGNAVTVSTTGAVNNATLNSSAGTPNETDTGSAVVVFTGEVITIGEAFTTGSAANYISSLACTGLGNGTTLVGNLLTIGATPGAIVCTETNARRSTTFTLAKSWINGAVNDAVTVSANSNEGGSTSLASTANTPTETDSGTPVNVFAGEVVTISEVFNTGLAANYNSSVSCTGNSSALNGNVFTVSATDTAIVCTETNTRRGATLTLRKTWANATVNDAVTVSTTGASNNGSLNSTANSANETDTGGAVNVFAGEAIAIGEAFTTGNAANYVSTLACTGNESGLNGNVLTVDGTDTAIVCTETNTRRAATLTLAKTWVNATVNEAVTVSTIGATNNASLNSTANTANETDTGVAVTTFAGEVITIGEAFTTGSAADYTSSLACTGLGNGNTLVGNVLTLGATPGNITCTETNTHRTATLTLAKRWVNATVNNAVTVSATGTANTATLGSVANTANETDTGAPVSVFVGETVTIRETFTTGSASAYTSALSCVGNSVPLVGNVLTITANDNGIVCTETNTRIVFPALTVTKTATPSVFAVGQPASYAVTVTNTGEAATTGNITLTDNLASGITLVSAAGANWTCSGTTSLSCTFTGALAPAASTTLTLNVSVGQGAINGNNTATASGGGDQTCPEVARCTGTVLVPIQAGISLHIVKSANPVRINAGSLILYTLTISNIVNYPVVNAQVIDMPPNGLAYVPGSGTIYDSNSANNSVSGARPIIFSGVDVAVGQTIRIQYLLRAGAALAAGEYTNFATAYQFGQPISNTASTTVYAETGADPLLEQTRILGKVWDDQNGDGWQDPGERGIPGVRLASVEGLVSETDAYGRYHLEGLVLLNQERGQNFILKLDPSTLPPGSTLTTENPLLRRITAAIPARFDFGVKLPPMPSSASSQVDMDLGEINFTPGSTEIRPEYLGVLDRMAAQIHSHQSGEVFIDSASGSSPLAFERAGRVRDQLIERLAPEERGNFVITLRLQSRDGTSGEVSVSDTVKLGEVLFDTDKSVIKPEFTALLDKIVVAIESVGAGRVTVVGHADLRGSVEYNQALGLRRANAVYKYIAQRLSPEARSKLSVEVEGAAQVPGAGQ